MSRSGAPSTLAGRDAPVFVLPRQQRSVYTRLLELMGRSGFVAMVAHPPGSGCKTLVRSAAREKGLVPCDFDIEYRYGAEELRRKLAMLSSKPLGSGQNAVWLVHNAELVDVHAKIWKSGALKDARVMLLVHDAPPALRREIPPLYVKRLTSYAVEQILCLAIERGDCPLAHAEVPRVVAHAAGDIHQAFILANFALRAFGDATSRPEHAAHRWFDTKALLNGQRVDPSKVDASWLFENALGRCNDLESAARLADSFATANVLGAEELTSGEFVHYGVWREREALQKRYFPDDALAPPDKTAPVLPPPLGRRHWYSYGPGAFANPSLQPPASIEDLMHQRCAGRADPDAKRRRVLLEPEAESASPRPEGGPKRLRSADDADSSSDMDGKRQRRLDPGPLLSAFRLDHARDRFVENDFRSNFHLARLKNDVRLQESLDEYTRWLRRFFVCIVEHSTDVVAQIIYYEDSDRIREVICRPPKVLMRTFPTLRIALGLQTSPKKEPPSVPLLEWYIEGVHRRTARHINMWTTPEDIARNEHDLNLFGGLRFDGRLAREGVVKAAFADPFPTARVARSVRRLSPTPPDVSSAAAFASPGAEWRQLEGCDFVLWHVKYVLCNADAQAFAYFVQWCGFIFQKRRKPGVMPQFLGEEGIGKSALLGSNQSGPGVFKRIYEQFYQWSNDIESLLGHFNADSMNKLFCLMEEGGTYRKGFRNNDKLKSLLTEGTQRVELKHVNAFCVNDNRAFAMCTNNRDSLKIMPGSRRFLCLEGNDLMSQRAVDEGRMDRATRLQYMAKLDSTKNDDEVAYQFFRYCMCLDLSGFNVDDPVRTPLFEEQRSHNECVVKQFLEQVRSGEYPLWFREEDLHPLRGEHSFTAMELFGRLQVFATKTGAHLNVDSAKGLGHALSKKYAAEAPKTPGRVSRYRLQIARE